MKNIAHFFKKHNIQAEHILSAYCQGRNLVICLDSGEHILCNMQMYQLMEVLPENEFITVRRGTILRKNKILTISDDGIYTLIDGSTYQGRKRYLKEHKILREKLGLNTLKKKADISPEQPRLPLTLLEKCSILDDMPMAYCIIELVFDEYGHGIDFIFRYCNKYMAVVEGVPVEDMIDHSFYEVFKNGDKKWLITYADVALNGVQRTLSDYSPEIGKTLSILCYQPEPGFCACVLQITDI